jgi:hypothetical protein
MLDFRDMLCRMSELKTDPFAMSAGRKSPTLDYGDLVRHVGVHRSWVIV